MSASFSSTLNTAPKQTTAATAAVAAAGAGGRRLVSTSNAQRFADGRLAILSQVAEKRYDTKDRILKMCRLLENKKRRALSKEEAQALTERIESIVYKSFDKAALDRVKSIHAERREQRQQQEQVSTTSATTTITNCENRMSLLEDVLGAKRMTEIEQLVSEIRAIRTGTSWAGIIRASLTFNASAGNPTYSLRKMPKEVDAIYFRTRLMSYYAHIENQASNSSFDTKRVHMYNWPELIDEAKANIAAYRNLEDTHRIIIADTPVVCMGGLCSHVASSPHWIPPKK
jgi:hypothetical protein